MMVRRMVVIRRTQQIPDFLIAYLHEREGHSDIVPGHLPLLQPSQEVPQDPRDQAGVVVDVAEGAHLGGVVVDGAVGQVSLVCSAVHLYRGRNGWWVCGWWW